VDDVKEGYVPEYRKVLDTKFYENYGVLTPSSSINPNNAENILRQNQLDAEDGSDEDQRNTTPAEVVNGNHEEDSESEETRYARELDDEQTQKKHQTASSSYPANHGKKRKRQSEQDIEQEEQLDQREVAASLLPKKKRRLLERIKYGQRLKETVIEKLEHKKEMIQKGQAQVSADSTVVYDATTKNNDDDGSEDE